ncbi:hypothetical protein ABGB16_08885 [Micromonospora sp. B11E3]|uniref:hypothetical protein n=1 Tax=Micromonospora sp. B11E3 TaxID=3153562 RepID=UPI00325D9A25
MANKKLGKVVAGAALGGASLLVFTPGIAFADGGHHDGDGGKVFAKPHVVRAGEEVKLIEVCEESQQDAFVWSKVTGRVELHKVDKDKDKDEHGKGKDEHGKGKGEHGKGEHGKGEHGKDEHGKDEHGKDEMGRGEEHGKEKDKDKGKDEHGKGEEGRPGGWGGGADASGREDWGGYEHGQKPEDEKGAKGRDEDKAGHDEDMRAKDEDKGRHEDKWAKDDDKSAKDDDKWAKDDDKGRHEDDKWGKDDDDSWEHGRDFVYLGEAKVDKDARPGRYELHGSCGEGELVVLPKGHVDGGDGGMTSTSTDRTMATTGAGLLGASALGGLVLLRRRRTDGSVA